MKIYHLVNNAVNRSPIGKDESIASYLGPITHRIPHLNIRHSSDKNSWRKIKSPYVSPRLGAIYLPRDFEDFIEILKANPLKKAGMKDSEDNLNFISAEAENWIFNDVESKSKYAEMWEGVPNVDAYAYTANDHLHSLIIKLPSLLNHRLNSDSRSFEIRFPSGYCPVTWGFVLAPDLQSLEASLIFRSLEVSRNLLNDLYLFMVYFGYVFTQYKDAKLFDINISSYNIFVQDAHRINFD